MQCARWKCASSSRTKEEGHVNVSRTDGERFATRTDREYTMYIMYTLERV